jgi:putative (di)nucleoside polyphosphate hydrolase
MTVQCTKTPAKENYRLGVGLMVINPNKEILVGKRIDQKAKKETGLHVDSWQMPQGGIDSKEAPHQAAMRELKEEIGTDYVRMIAISNFWYSYDFPQELQLKLWGGRFKGQCQKWYLLEYLGKDENIKISHSYNPEFSEWKWIAAKELPHLIVDFKKELYTNVLEEFQGFLDE